jgi:fumarate reductase subunit C
MIAPVRPKRLLCRIKRFLSELPARAVRLRRKVPSGRYAICYLRVMGGKISRRARYLVEDIWFGIRRSGSYIDAILFSAIIVLALAMLAGSAQAGFLDSLTVLILLVLTVVIYTQLKLQRRMMSRYVPMIDYVRIRGCQMYSDRIKVGNIQGVPLKMDEVKSVNNLKIKYDIINDSFSPISVEGVSVSIRLREKRTITLPYSTSVVDVEPKRTGGSEVSFRLKSGISFDSIEWLQLELRGNCRKSIRVKPHLYVNLMLREKVPRFIFEPFEKFDKRPELALEKGRMK